MRGMCGTIRLHHKNKTKQICLSLVLDRMPREIWPTFTSWSKPKLELTGSLSWLGNKIWLFCLISFFQPFPLKTDSGIHLHTTFFFFFFLYAWGFSLLWILSFLLLSHKTSLFLHPSMHLHLPISNSFLELCLELSFHFFPPRRRYKRFLIPTEGRKEEEGRREWVMREGRKKKL